MFHIFFIASVSSKLGQNKQLCDWDFRFVFLIWHHSITPHNIHHTFRHEDRWIGKHFLQLFDMCLKCFWCPGMLFWCEDGWRLLIFLVEAKHISPFERVKKWLFLHCLKNQKSSAFTINRCFKMSTYATNDSKKTWWQIFLVGDFNPFQKIEFNLEIFPNFRGEQKIFELSPPSRWQIFQVTKELRRSFSRRCCPGVSILNGNAFKARSTCETTYRNMREYTGVSLHGGTPKTPQNDHFENRKTHGCWVPPV